MKAISFWAHEHKAASRVCVVFIYLLLNILGLLTGDILYSMNVVLPFSFYFGCVLIVLIGVIIYPSKKDKSRYSNFYTRQKFADSLLISVTFLLTIYSGNSINTNQLKNYNPIYAHSIITHNADPLNNINTSFINKKSVAVSKKPVGKNFKATLKELRKKYRESTKTAKTIYIILSILGAIFLIYILAGLSCSIACSGSEALADIIFVVGLAGIIYAQIKLVQRITRGKPKKPRAEPAPQ